MNTEPTSPYHQLICALVIDIAASLMTNIIQSLTAQISQGAFWC